MCTNYTPATPQHLLPMTDLGPVSWTAENWPSETFPGYRAPILTARAEGADHSATGLQATLARFGLIPRWCQDAVHAAKVGRGTYNARCETVAEKPSFRSAWRERRFALVPMLDYFEPCWESGRAVRWRIEAQDGNPLLAAALHERWTDTESGTSVHSFSLLTANANAHPLLSRMHRPGDEKRQLRLVPPDWGLAWLGLAPKEALAGLGGLPERALRGFAAPLREDPQSALF
ncbi:MAG: SOS response-associated peptidase family protein [Hydrogenophaga sp.]